MHIPSYVQHKIIRLGLGYALPEVIVNIICEYSTDLHPCEEEIKRYPNSSALNPFLAHSFLYTKLSFVFEGRVVTLWAHDHADYVECDAREDQFENIESLAHDTNENVLIDADDFGFRSGIRNLSDLEIYMYVRSLQRRGLACDYVHDAQTLYPDVKHNLLDSNFSSYCIGNHIFTVDLDLLHSTDDIRAMDPRAMTFVILGEVVMYFGIALGEDGVYQRPSTS